jgi:P2-related tail formation protein
VALVPRGDVGEDIKRQLIARAIPLYRRRGTKDGLEDLLRIYALGVRIEEPTGWLQLGVSSTVEVDTRLDGPPPHVFRVVLTLAEGVSSSEEIGRQRRLLEAIIDAEKPAHTQYTLDVVDPNQFTVGVHSTVGVDTMLG